MRKRIKALVIAILTTGAPALVFAGPPSSSPLVELPTAKANARAGACSFPDGGWTIVNCSESAAATSSALRQWSRYVLQCGVNSYVSWGDASGDVADANDGYLPAGAWLEFVTTDTVRYVSCLNITTDSDCRYIECL